MNICYKTTAYKITTCKTTVNYALRKTVLIELLCPGNQLDGVHLEWEDVKQKYFARYGMSLPF